MSADKIREYDAEGIVVGFTARRCIHVKNCVRELPEVFDVDKRPWIAPDEASADRVAAQVARCPTGALTARTPDGEPIESVPDEPVTRVETNGPLYVSGDVDVVDADGGVYPTGRRAALCRCGASENKPYCDGAHEKIGFVG